MNQFINKSNFQGFRHQRLPGSLGLSRKIFAKTVATKIENRKLDPEQAQITDNYLLFVEHPHVYTLGKSGRPENLLLNEAGLKSFKPVIIQ